MFRQNNAILRERLCSFPSHFSVSMVGDKSQDIWRNLHTGVRQYGKRQVKGHMTEPTYRCAIIARRYVGSVICPVSGPYHIYAEVVQKRT
jgi:hypothetical protein